MSFWSEFKQFAVKGNVIDLAVGVIIGTAFNKIVTSFVNDIFMPPIGVVLKNVDFNNMKLPLSNSGATLNYGSFIQNIVDFLIVALVVFLFVRFANRFRKKQEMQSPPPAPSKEEVLLTEIRDILKQK